jgi:beta-lactamase regulating signal transducer with metallopeptidase domain
MPNHSWLAEFSFAVWPALADHLWQATLVVAMCFLALPAFRRSGARARQALWLVAFARFVVPPALVIFIAGCVGFKPGSLIDAGARMRQVSTVVTQVAWPSALTVRQVAPADGPAQGHTETYCLLTVIWVLGVIVLLCRWWLRKRRFAALLRTAKDEYGTQIEGALQSLRKKLRISRAEKLRVVSANLEPGVWGVWKPVLVLPEDMSQLSRDEVEAVLAHELVHVVRRDNLWSHLQMLVCCIFWFHPLVWLLDRRLAAERERACDERVIDMLRNSQAYASGLIKMVSIGLGLRADGFAAMAGSNLKARIENIMTDTAKRKTGWNVRILLSAVATLAILLYLVAAPLQESVAKPSSINPAIAAGTVTAGNQPVGVSKEPERFSADAASRSQSSPIPHAPPVPPPPPLDQSPNKDLKSVSVNIEKSAEASFDLKPLDGSTLELEGKDVTYRSTPILTDGPAGKCKFEQLIPPGEYKLKMSIFGIATPLAIPDLPQSKITINMNVGKGIAITLK